MPSLAGNAQMFFRILSPLSRLQKNPLFTRRLKKAQVQGAAQSEARGVLSRVPIPMGASQRRAGYPFRWVAATPQMGLLQQPVKLPYRPHTREYS